VFKLDGVVKGEAIFPSSLKEHPSASYYLWGTLQNLDSGLWTGPWTGLWTR